MRQKTRAGDEIGAGTHARNTVQMPLCEVQSVAEDDQFRGSFGRWSANGYFRLAWEWVDYGEDEGLGKDPNNNLQEEMAEDIVKDWRAFVIGGGWTGRSPLTTQIQGSGLQGDLHRLHSCGGGERQRSRISCLHNPPPTHFIGLSDPEGIRRSTPS